MHENREISRTSCSKEQDRSAKAINQTADMHVLEKSDWAVVPVNQWNREAQASAEAGEGRAQTKENIVQSHRLPTQSGLVPGIARCATSSISKEAGTVHRFTPPPQRRSSTRELLCPEASSLAGSRWHEVAG